MKRYVSLILATILSLNLVACGNEEKGNGKPEYMSDSFYNAGVNLIQTLDKTIDVEIDVATAYENAKYYEEVIDQYTVSESDYPTAEAQIFSIQITTDSIIMDLSRAKAGYELGRLPDNIFDELLEERNELAEQFNIDKK